MTNRVVATFRYPARYPASLPLLALGLTVPAAAPTAGAAHSVTMPIALAAAPLAAAPAAPAPAAPAPQARSSAGEVTITARDQPIAAFLRDLFGRVGRPVVPSGSLTGTVNGVFRGSVNKIYSDVAKAFNLISYDDGAALYVYAASELQVETFSIGNAAANRVARQLRAQGLTDRRNYARSASDGTLVVSGTPRFVEQATAYAQNQSGGNAMAGGGGLGGFGGGGAFAPPKPQPLEFRVFYLRYARAEDSLTVAGGRETRIPGLATILQNLVLDQRPGGSGGGPLGGTSAPQIGARQVRQSANRLGGLGLNSVAGDASQSTAFSQPYGDGDVLGFGGADLGGGDTLAPLTADVVRIEPNSYLNAIIVRDVPERMPAYDSLIRALDVEPQIVEVEATIIDINIDKTRELGVNFRFGSGGFGFLNGNGTDDDIRLLPIPGTSRRQNTDNITPRGLGGTISTIIGNNREFIGRVRALESKGAARIVSRPQVMTLSNVEAVFDRTSTFYVRVAGDRQVDLFNVTAGTVLRVNPHVFRDHDQTRVRMLVNIEDGSLDLTTDVQDIPIVDRSSVATQAMVLDGESLLLGGMTIDADRERVEKIPLLGDIPLLGNLFKTRSKSRQRVERLFLITPRLVTLGAGRPLPASADTSTMSPLPPNTLPPVPPGGFLPPPPPGAPAVTPGAAGAPGTATPTVRMGPPRPVVQPIPGGATR